jgi:hypothetical protein
LRAKLRASVWALRHRRLVLMRRQFVQAQRTVDDRAIMPMLAVRVAPTNVSVPPGLGFYNRVVAAWCRLLLPGR